MARTAAATSAPGASSGVVVRVVRALVLAAALTSSSALLTEASTSVNVVEDASVPIVIASEAPPEGGAFTVASQLAELSPGAAEEERDEEDVAPNDPEEEYDDDIEYVDDLDEDEEGGEQRRMLRNLAAKKKVKNPASVPGAPNQRTFNVATVSYRCNMLSWQGPTLWKNCKDEVTNANVAPRNVNVNFNQNRFTPDVGCGQACISYNLGAGPSAGTCMGGTVIARGKCRLAVCPAGSRLSNTPGLVSNKRQWPSKSFKPRTFSFPPECNEPEPTPAPTQAPIPYCHLDSDALNKMPSLSHKFEKVIVDTAKNCEVSELRSPNGARFFIQESYTCDLESCIRWCAYDALCKYAGYSPKLQQCYKSTGTQTTDDPSRVGRYIWEDWTIMKLKFSEGGDPTTPYYGGKCALLVGGGCKAEKECGLNKGKMGYNDEKIGGGANQYCGRTKCTPVPYRHSP